MTPSEQIVNFDDLLQLVDDLRADSNDQRGATPFVVVRLEKQKDGTMQINQDDFENTSLPMTQDSRVPKANIETRQVYQPEIAFEEFLDNSLQYVQHSEVKIISTTIDLKQNLISFLDTGEGISFDDIRQWATPADAYVGMRSLFHTYPNCKLISQHGLCCSSGCSGPVESIQQQG